MKKLLLLAVLTAFVTHGDVQSATASGNIQVRFVVNTACTTQNSAVTCTAPNQYQKTIITNSKLMVVSY